MEINGQRFDLMKIKHSYLYRTLLLLQLSHFEKDDHIALDGRSSGKSYQNLLNSFGRDKKFIVKPYIVVECMG